MPVNMIGIDRHHLLLLRIVTAVGDSFCCTNMRTPVRSGKIGGMPSGAVQRSFSHKKCARRRASGRSFLSIE